MEKFLDAVIIGGGPGGASAALYIARGNKTVAVVDGGASALIKAHVVQNYFGTGAVSGEALYRTGIKQAREVGAQMIAAHATACAQVDGGFETTLDNGRVLRSRSLVVATGAARKSVDIDGLKQYEGRGVSYCAVCDAFFHRKKRVGVIGAGSYAEHELSALKNIAGDLCLFTDGAEPSFDTGDTRVYTSKIARIVGEERVTGVRLDDGTTVEVDGVFVALGTLGASGIAKSVGVLLNEKGEIVTDERGMTNIDRLYAVGDCTAGIKQVAKAVCDGMTAGLDIVKRG